jgi:hypothetical protein
MRSELDSGRHAGVAGPDKYRTTLVRMLNGTLRSGETIVAILPFVTSMKRPKIPGAPRGKAGKVRIGIYQSWRRYRPIVLTNRRLFVFETGRTPNPRELLAAFDNDEVDVVMVTQTGRSVTRFTLELPGTGPVPFEAGRREQDDLTVLIETLGGVPT